MSRRLVCKVEPTAISASRQGIEVWLRIEAQISLVQAPKLDIIDYTLKSILYCFFFFSK
jgi:hypothetical protein